MFTDDHFVAYKDPQGKLGRKHRALVREHVVRTRHKKYLQVGKPGLLHLSWRVGPAPKRAVQPSEASSPAQGSKDKNAPAPWSDLHDSSIRLSEGRLLSGNQHDPFGSLPIAKRGNIDPSRTLARLFRGWSSTLEFEYGPRPGEVQDPFLHKLLPIAVQHADVLGAVLTDGQYWWDQMVGPPSASGQHAVLYYRGQTMTHLRLQLSTKNHPVGDSTIIAIVFLLGVDSYSHDSFSGDIHSRALQMAVSSRGGLRKLDPFVKFLIIIYNWWLQLSCLAPPLFPRDEYASDVQCLDTLSIASPLDVQQAAPRLPVNFVQVLQCHQTSIQLLDILERTQDWTASVQRLWSRQADTEDYEIFARCEAVLILEDVLLLRSKMREEPGSSDREDVVELGPEMLLVITLTLYLLNTMFKPMAQPWPVYQEALIEVTMMLEVWLKRWKQFLKLSMALRNAIIWCILVAVDSWRQTNNLVDPKGTALMESLLNSFTALQEWVVLKEVLQSSFWHGGLLKGWEVCWEAGRRSLVARSLEHHGVPATKPGC